MWRLTFAGIVAYKVRYALTALAVLLGVAFMAGTLVLTDTIGRTFDGLFTDIYHGTSAVVRAPEQFSQTGSFATQRPQIAASLVPVVRGVPGVADARIGITGYAQLVGADGKPIGNPGAGAPTLGEAWNDVASMNPYRFLPGSLPPRADTQVAIDKHSADVGHLRVGQRVLVLTKQPPRYYTITGIFRWGTADSPLGASITVFTPGTAAHVLGQPGKVDEIDVAASSGVSQQQLVQRLRAALPSRGVEVITGAQITREGQNAVHDALRFFNTFLLVFAVIALFVGSFLIFNTFSIVVAQRLRELALLRALGAGRGQVMRSVLGESVVIGALASGAGLGAGIGLAVALRAMLNAFGVDIPATGLVVNARTVVVCVLIGTAVTVLAALSPARKAGNIAPITALREDEANEETRRTARTASGALITGAGLSLLLTGLFADVSHRVTYVGVGAAVTFMGAAVLGPLISRPLSRVVGAPLRWRGVTGLLARNNAMRSPKRTASTAAALMIGVALVAVMSVLASSLRSSAGAAIDRAMRADFVISTGTAQPGAPVGLSPQLQRQLAALPQVESSTGVRADTVRIGGKATIALATDPTRVDELFDVGLAAGDVTRMTSTGIAVSQYVADNRHLALGSRIPVTFARTGTKTFRVQAIYTARDVAGDYVLPIAAAQRDFTTQLDFQVYLKLVPGTGDAAARRAIDRVLAAYPTAKLLDRAEYKAQQMGQIDQLLNLVYGLLALALLIALIGIANTLSLSIYERTRELGLLRAVGMTRGQLRAMVRAESVIIALIGAAEGLLVGTLLGWAVVHSLAPEGVRQLSIPIGELVVVALLAVLAGVVAAAPSARRAARLDVLRAIATH
jgi:putative ABC transport system permease protein